MSITRIAGASAASAASPVGALSPGSDQSVQAALDPLGERSILASSSGESEIDGAEAGQRSARQTL